MQVQERKQESEGNEGGGGEICVGGRAESSGRWREEMGDAIAVCLRVYASENVFVYFEVVRVS